MGKLTAIAVRNAKEPCRLADGEGLSFEITKSGIKRWLYRYRLAEKQQMYILGRYPNMSLADARLAHNEAKQLVQEGINPAQDRRAKKYDRIEQDRAERDKRSKDFERIARKWINKQRDSWSSGHTQKVITSLENDVFNKIGNRPIDTITVQDLVKILNKIEKRGSLEVARKVLQRISSVFRFAVINGDCTHNTAENLKGTLTQRKVTHMPAVTKKHDLGQLMKDIAINPKIHPQTKLALQFLALTACRSQEVRLATWSEINLEEKIFEIPSHRMKMNKEHIIPLSTQAIAILERAGKLWGTEGLIFPSVRDYTKPMSDNTMSKAFRDMGYRGKATPHGFRASFSSIAHEQSGFPSEVIEKALAHEEKNKVKGAYNRAEYLGQRRDLLQWWGNNLQDLECQ